jgi:manganese/iron transport system ATP-binding protein
VSGAAVRARGLSVAYGDRVALDAVDLTAGPGVLVGVLGPNGAGKTTLLRALLGAVPHAGRVELAGRTAYVPQVSEAMTSFPVDALGVVLMGRYPRLGWARRPRAADRAAALGLLEHVGLGDRARTPFGALSGGQRQRTLVARALAQEGDVLLLDEPLTGIDTPSQDVILAVLREQAVLGRTVLMTTHDLAQAARTCDELVLLDGGLVAHGPPAEVFRADVLRRAYGSELLLLDGATALVDDPHCGPSHAHPPAP